MVYNKVAIKIYEKSKFNNSQKKKNLEREIRILKLINN